VKPEQASKVKVRTPTRLHNGEGRAGVVAAPIRSAFQEDLIVIRLRARCAWGAITGGVQFVQKCELVPLY
jgi:hypothetical protein